MSIFVKPKIRWDQKCLALELNWSPTREEELALHNLAWEANHQGKLDERKRILALITDYWCGEENCKKHGTDWEAFIKEIEDGNK